MDLLLLPAAASYQPGNQAHHPVKSDGHHAVQNSKI